MLVRHALPVRQPNARQHVRPFVVLRPSHSIVSQALSPSSGPVESAKPLVDMPSISKGPATILAALLLLGCTGDVAAAQDTWTGPARVVDGDTLYIDNQKFRLYGVDAPEKTQLCLDARGSNYQCGIVSKDALTKKVANKVVSCKRKAVDQYGREVAVCSLLGGPAGAEDLNKWLVDNGYAVAYRQYGKEYIPAEEAAKKSEVGIWSGAFEYPAQWRKEEKANLPHPPLKLATTAPAPTPVPAPAPKPVVPGTNTLAPPDCGPGVKPIKGNINAKGAKIYHLPDGPYYDKVLVEPEKGESYFCTEAEAVKAGYRPVAPTNPPKSG